MSWLAKDLPASQASSIKKLWLQVVPRSRGADFSTGLRVKTADPLWLLARQWQLGEFRGLDRGSSVAAEVEHSLTSIAQVGWEGAGESVKTRPVEMVVEQMPRALDYRTRVQVGLQFERLVRAALGPRAAARIARLKQSHALVLPEPEVLARQDEATERFLRVVAGRVLDGQALLARGQPPATPNAQDPLGDLTLQLVALRSWFETVCARPKPGAPDAWQPRKLSHAFTASDVGKDAGAATVLAADDYASGDLEWHAYKAVQLGSGADRTAIARPTRIEFGGATVRWWTFEEADLNPAQLFIARTDLSKLLFADVALTFPNDWNRIPLGVPRGALVRTHRLRVRDVFGVWSTLEPANQPSPSLLQRFELFTLSPHEDPNAPGDPSSLLVPAVAGFRVESPALEEVGFVRDEGANLVWGIERVVTNGLGKPVKVADLAGELRRRQQELETGGAGAASPADPNKTAGGESGTGDEPLRYRLAAGAPQGWIPFVPVSSASFFERSHGAIRLRRARMLQSETDDRPLEVNGMTDMLRLQQSHPLLWLNEESVPRGGVTVQVTKQHVRWTHGETYVWVGRKVVTGCGEGASVLRFDVVGTRSSK